MYTTASARNADAPQAAQTLRRCGEVDAEQLEEVAGDRVAVERGDHVGPNLSVLMRVGSWPSATSASDTPSTNPVGPQM